MPITKLDSKTALVLIELQKMVVSRALAPFTAGHIIKNSVSLVSAFRKAGLPIVVVNVIPAQRTVPLRSDTKMPVMQFQKEWVDIIPEIAVHPDDILITKHTWSAFYNTPLDEELQKRGVTGIVLAGVATSIGVEGSARGAYERGYNITFACDAMSDTNEKAHENSLTVIFPRIGEVDSTKAILEYLDRA